MAHTYTILPKNIPQIIADIVAVVSDNLATEIGSDIQFLHGTWASIRSRIVEEASGTVIKNTRFPLVCLVQVFEEKYKANSEYGDVSLTLLICNNSEQTWYAEQRYTSNYIPILYPIYAEFMAVLNTSPYFVGYKEKYYQHTKADDLHLPENNDNKLPECLDGLWIKDLQLRLDDKCLPVYNEINTVLEFGTPSQVGDDLNLPFKVAFSDIGGLKNGSIISFSMIADNNLAVSVNLTTNSSLYCQKVGNNIKITDISLFTDSLDLVGVIDNPLNYAIETTGKVVSISGMKNEWLNKYNTKDIVIYIP
jgi:hypothetical protein